MTTRDPRSRAPTPAVQGYGRDPTQSLSLDAAIDDGVEHPSLALGTHEAGRAARARLTSAESPGGRSTPPTPDRGGPPPIPPPIPRAATAEPDLLGSVLGSYKIAELLGRGGMGYVFRAEHVKLGREVALKLLRGDYAIRRDAVARFFQEARTVNRVRHRNIVDVTDFVELDDGTTFIIMELLRGESLGRWARSGIDLPRALVVLVQICDGLAAAHEVGVVHRDLKPDNVFVVPTPDGGELVKLLDFGVAKLLNRDDEDVGFQTAAGSVIGTPAYMSPEQAGGMAVDARSDIYSLGAIMYELFSGQPMFRGRSFGEYVRKHLTEMPPPPRSTPGGAQIDPRLEALIMKCLEKDPIQRFAKILDLRDALLAMLGGMETQPPGLVSLAGSGVRAGANLGPSLSIPSLPQLPGGAVAQLPTQLLSPSGSHASYQAYGSRTVPPTGIRPPATPWWAWAVGGALAVGLGIAAAVWYADRADISPAPTAASGSQPVSQPAPIAEPIAPTAAAPVEVRFDSTPEATVFAEGSTSAVCRTPCTYDIDPRDGGSPDQRRYVIRADGYQDAPIVVDLKGSQRNFRVTLAPIVEPAAVTPALEDSAAKPNDSGDAKPTDSGDAKPEPRPRVVKRPAARPRPSDQAARPNDSGDAKPNDGGDAKPSDARPDDTSPIEPAERRPTKKPASGPIDPTDTLDPFRQKKR